MTGKEVGYIYSKLIRIGSDYRMENSTNFNTDTKFMIDMGENLKAVLKISVVSVSFPHQFPNVYAGNQKMIVEYRNGAWQAPFNLYLPIGWYNIVDIMSAIANIVNGYITGVGGTLTMAFNQDPVSNFVTMTLSNVGALEEIKIWLSEDVTDPFQLMGFPTAFYGSKTSVPGYTVYLYSVNGNYKCANLPQLQGIQEVHLLSKTLAPGRSFDEKGHSGNTIIVIPITVPYGYNQVFECKVDRFCELTYPAPRDLGQIDFELTNRFGETLDSYGGTTKLNMRAWFNRF